MFFFLFLLCMHCIKLEMSWKNTHKSKINFMLSKRFKAKFVNLSLSTVVIFQQFLHGWEIISWAVYPAVFFSFRLYHGRVRQGALHCLLAVVKGVEKRTLYGYWSSFIPDSPIGGPPPLTLLTIILKDPSPKVQHTLTHVTSLLDTCGCSIAFCFPTGARVCASGVVSHAGRLPSVPCRGWRYGVSSYILHTFLLLAGHCRQRAAPLSQSGSASWDLPSDSHTGHKGTITCENIFWQSGTKRKNQLIRHSHRLSLLVSGLPGGKRSLPPPQTWSAQPALEADASLCASQRSVLYFISEHTRTKENKWVKHASLTQLLSVF